MTMDAKSNCSKRVRPASYNLPNNEAAARKVMMAKTTAK